MSLAKKVGEAKKQNDTAKLKEAEESLKNYEDLIKKSDRMLLNCYKGDL